MEHSYVRLPKITQNRETVRQSDQAIKGIRGAAWRVAWRGVADLSLSIPRPAAKSLVPA